MNRYICILLLCLFFIIELSVATIAGEYCQTSESAAEKNGHRNSDSQNSIGKSVLTLEDALNRTLHFNPALKAYAAEIRARKAAAVQADLLPNPDLEFEVENFGGQDEQKGFDGAETTIALSQLIELGGKRNKRYQIALLEKDLAKWDFQSQKSDILTSVSKTFITVLVAQEQVRLSENLVELTEQTAAAVAHKANAGKVSPVEKTKAQVELASARSEARRSDRELKSAKKRLSSFWGSEEIDFDCVSGDLSDLEILPAKETLKKYLQKNPDLARWKSETDHGEAMLALARSAIFPDLTLSAGVRNSKETDNHSYVAGFSLPIPVFNRNQGGVVEAKERVDKIKDEQHAVETALLADFYETWQRLSSAYEESITLRDDILPGAQEVYMSTYAGYREGKLAYLQILDAQRTLFTVKRQYLMSLSAYHTAKADMNRLTGVFFDEISK